jgi:peptidoglycan hydrolase FlgJ
VNSLFSMDSPARTSGFAYSDINGLKRIGSGEEGVRAAAQQFESLFIGMMLKSMRDAGAVLAEGNPLSSPEMDMHREMLDQQWAIHMAESGGIGLAPIIEAQLRGERRAIAPAPPLPPTAPASAPRQRVDDILAFELGSKRPGFDSRAAFIAELLPEIEAALVNKPLQPLHVLAQSALETGWGQHVIHGPDGRNSHNLFGIKAGASWQGDSVEVKTLEVIDGRPEIQSARFRSYPDVESAVQDYVRLLESDPRYRDVLRAQNEEGFASAIQQSGYATDPAYGRKIKAVLGSVRVLMGS